MKATEQKDITSLKEMLGTSSTKKCKRLSKEVNRKKAMRHVQKF